MPITYGPSGQPGQATFNYDALFSSSLAAYRDTLQDNISASNVFFKKIKWESEDGGAFVAEDLLYGLSPVDTYSGYDILPTTVTNGITQAHFQWSQVAAPVSISNEELKKNKKRIINLMTAKIQQAEIGVQEFWAKAFLRGSLAGSGTSLIAPYTSTVTGAPFVDPLPRLIFYAAGGSWPSLEIGNINQSTNTWWRNRSRVSAATTREAFMTEMLNMYNLCSIGPGGAPDLILCDQVTWELVHASYRSYFQNNAMSDGNFPFPNLKFFNSLVVWDEFVPDVANNSLDTDTGRGTMYFINSKFYRCVYEADTNFIATSLERPINQDAFFKHILWMGAVTMSNRRKHGVIGNIARTLS